MRRAGGEQSPPRIAGRGGSAGIGNGRLVVSGASGLKAPAPRGSGARRVRAGLRPSSLGRLGAACPLPEADGKRSAPIKADIGPDPIRKTCVGAEFRQNRSRLEAKRIGQPPRSVSRHQPTGRPRDFCEAKIGKGVMAARGHRGRSSLHIIAAAVPGQCCKARYLRLQRLQVELPRPATRGNSTAKAPPWF